MIFLGQLGHKESQRRSQPDIWSCKCKFFYRNRPYNYKEVISKEINNDDVNLNRKTKLSGWLRY